MDKVDIEKRVSELERKKDLRVKQDIILVFACLVTVLALNYI